MTFKIFIMHYTPLKERFNIMNNQLKKENVPYEFIIEHDREKLTEKELQIFDTQKVKLSMCSNISKHILTYQKIIISDYNYNLMSKTQPLVTKDLINYLQKYQSRINNSDLEKLIKSLKVGNPIPMDVYKYVSKI